MLKREGAGGTKTVGGSGKRGDRWHRGGAKKGGWRASGGVKTARTGKNNLMKGLSRKRKGKTGRRGRKETEVPPGPRKRGKNGCRRWDPGMG